MNFIHQPLAWAFLLVLLPLLIHLINMMRHRRVKWAAMEFLLASYKKHRKWIWLKQLILLLTRMAAIAAVVFIMAQWIPPDQWAKLFGGKVTHHYVLLDDSLSMTDRGGDGEAFERAKKIVEQIAKFAAEEETHQRLTVIRYSKAAAAEQAAGDSGGSEAQLSASQNVADVSDQLVSDGVWREKWNAQRGALMPSQMAVGPQAAMALLTNLLAQDEDQSRIVYVVSDFRQSDWENPADIDKHVQQWTTSGAQVHLVDCVPQSRPNLAVTHVAPVEGTRSAGVPLFVTVTVKNFGEAVAENVDLTITSLAYEPFDARRHGDEPSKIKPEPLDKRTQTIKKIPPGGTAKVGAQVRFPIAGNHVVEAKLPDDAIAADNVRYCVVDFPVGEPVLIVDGDDERRNAYRLVSAFYPNDYDPTSLAGIQPTVESPSRLREISRDKLSGFRAVYLLDVPRLDDVALDKLEEFVRAGGGLAIFLGDKVSASTTHYNERWYREGEGLLPMPLGMKEPMAPPEDVDEPLPDFDVDDHPVLRFLAAGNGLFLRGVRISEYLLPADDWSIAKDPTVQVLATLRDEMATPLVLEKPFGEGRVMMFNTTAAPLWNNWAREPSFPATMALAHGYLAAPLRVDQSQLVAAPVRVSADAEEFTADAIGVIPAATAVSRKPVILEAVLNDESENAGEAELAVTLAETNVQGIYEIWTSKKTGELEGNRFAVNVDPNEGDLTKFSLRKTSDQMQAPFTYHTAGEVEYAAPGQSSSRASEYLLCALIVLLLGEQLLAYSASYHPSPGAAR